MAFDSAGPLWQVCPNWVSLLQRADLSPQDDGLILALDDDMEF